jgi:hypothetical protein
VLGLGCSATLVAVAVAGCGRLGFESAPAADADPGGADGALTIGCTAAGPWISDFSALPSWATTWALPGIPMAATTVSGGTLRLSPSVISGEFAGIRSLATLPLIDRQLTVEVIQVTEEALTFFGVDQGGPPWLRIQYFSPDQLIATVDQTNAATVTYDPIQHRFWRLRERAGTTYFETSPDGAAFAVLHETPTPAFAAAVSLSVGAGTNSAISTPGVGVVELADDCFL